jgi:hypothetical protein
MHRNDKANWRRARGIVRHVSCIQLLNSIGPAIRVRVSSPSSLRFRGGEALQMPRAASANFQAGLSQCGMPVFMPSPLVGLCMCAGYAARVIVQERGCWPLDL